MEAQLYCGRYKEINQALGIVLEGKFQLQKTCSQPVCQHRQGSWEESLLETVWSI